MRAVMDVMLLASKGASRVSPSARTRPLMGCTMQAVPHPKISLSRPSRPPPACKLKCHPQRPHKMIALPDLHLVGDL